MTLNMDNNANIDTIAAIVEAILFTTGKAITAEKIASIVECDNKTVKRAIISLMEKYDSDSHGIRIIEIDNAYQFSTKIEMYDYLIKLVKQPKKYTLTDVVLETLSIIAYKQPVTRGEIEKIRGVSCDHAINKLIEYGLVEEVGRLDVPGRPLLFGTTEEFLRSFGVKKIDELPVLNPDQIEEFKQEVEKEVQIEISC